MTPRPILLVEDNPVTRKMVRFALETSGLDVLEAPDGQTALRLADAHHPPLILQDLMLPDFDGLDLARQLRASHGGADARIIAFSGFISQADEARLSSAGFDDVVTKPIEPSRLVSIVESNLPPRLSPQDCFGTGKTVVVADDDVLQLKIARFRLEQLGFQVHTAEDGRRALRMALEAPPDAIIADVLMPQLDGFALARDIRRTGALAHLPLILVTSSYVEPEDRDLAKRSGATDLVVRTPALEQLITSLRGVFSLRNGEAPVRIPEEGPVLEREHVSRIVRQLERQTLLNGRIVQRSATLAAELRVLAGISDVILARGDVQAALDDVIASCLDAGGVSVGALYLVNDAGVIDVRALGTAKTRWSRQELESLFKHPDLLDLCLTSGKTLAMPSANVPETMAETLLEACGATSALLVPLKHSEVPFGALFMATRNRNLADEDWQAFAQGVAGQLTLALSLARAFAERQRSEERAAEQEKIAREQAELLRLILDSVAEGIVVGDKDGQLVLWNRAAQRILPPMAKGEAVSVWPDLLKEVVQNGKPADVDAVPTEIGGRPAWLSGQISPIRRDADVVGAVVIARDVTQQKKTEAQLIASDRMASVGTLAAGVAHEINNPLAAVLANLELASHELDSSEGMPSPELPELVNDARTAADRIRQIVKDLRIFSRAEKDSATPTSVPAVLESSMRMAWNEIRHRARLVKEIRDVPRVLANESRLGQVFLNLVVNAAQAIPEGRASENEIRIGVSMDGDNVAVRISDTGTGMSQEVLGRLFTPFFTTKPPGVGTGLGLSICHKIVTSMGGEIRIHSEQGKGSTFTVLLPAADDAVTSEIPPVVDMSLPVRRGSILVIDDESLITNAVSRILGEYHDVRAVPSARNALELLLAGTDFDVILCDLMMPEITGMDFHAELSEIRPELASRVIFITGGAFTARARSFIDSVPNHRIEKPFEAMQLRALVNEKIT